MNIKRGTRVKHLGTDWLEPLKAGSVGTVLRDHDIMGDSLAVSWDDFSEGHFCDGLLPNTGPASGWFVNVHNIEILTEVPSGESGADSAETEPETGTHGVAQSDTGTRTPVSGSKDDREDSIGSV